MSRKAKSSFETSQAPVQKLRCAIYTRKSTEEGLDQEYNSLDAQRLHLVNKTRGVFRPAERRPEAGQAEAVVDALAEDSAEVFFPFQNDDIVDAVFM